MTGNADERLRRFLILHNTRAGHNRIGLVEQVVQCLTREGAVVDLVQRTGGEGADLSGVAAERYDAIVASGGDGTMRHVLADVAGADVPLGLIPVGTANVLAIELALPRGAEDIARMLLDGRTARISTARVNEEPFLLMCGIGLDGDIVGRVREPLKHRVGRLAFVWPTVQAFATRPRLFEATIDGRKREMSWLIVSNASRYGGRFVLTRRTSVLEPGFSVVMSRALGRHQRLAEMMALAAGRLEQCPTIEIVSAQTVEVCASGDLPVQIDGDAFTAPSIRLQANASTASLLIP